MAQALPVKRLPTSSEQAAQGLEARTRVPIASHGQWRPDPKRPDPIALLESQAPSRIPWLVPIRYGRMAASPFSFLRGAALPMAADLASTPRTGFEVQLAGDAHLSNFGLFASPERDTVFDIDDFDEALVGPFEWDIKRLAASMVVAAQARGLSAHQSRQAAHLTVRSYRERMHEYAQMRAIDVYYSHVDVAEILAFVAKRARPYLESTLKSAAHHDALHELPKLTELVGDLVRRIIDHPPVITHPPDVTVPIERTILDSYLASLQSDRRMLLDRYQLIDAALKVVGVGSVGLSAYVGLLDGGDGDDPLFLQVKEAEASVLERFLGPSPYATHGERVVAGQRALQATSDVLLGWAVGPMGRHHYVRQLQDRKGSAVVEAMTFDDLTTWGRLCGWALARGHARTGEPAVIAAYLGADDAFDEALGAFAAAYADQTEADHAALLAAIKSGRVKAQEGV